MANQFAGSPASTTPTLKKKPEEETVAGSMQRASALPNLDPGKVPTMPAPQGAPGAGSYIDATGQMKFNDPAAQSANDRFGQQQRGQPQRPVARGMPQAPTVGYQPGDPNRPSPVAPPPPTASAVPTAPPPPNATDVAGYGKMVREQLGKNLDAQLKGERTDPQQAAYSAMLGEQAARQKFQASQDLSARGFSSGNSGLILNYDNVIDRQVAQLQAQHWGEVQDKAMDRAMQFADQERQRIQGDTRLSQADRELAQKDIALKLQDYVAHANQGNIDRELGERQRQYNQTRDDQQGNKWWDRGMEVIGAISGVAKTASGVKVPPGGFAANAITAAAPSMSGIFGGGDPYADFTTDLLSAYGGGRK